MSGNKNKKVLIRPKQADTTKDKKVAIVSKINNDRTSKASNIIGNNKKMVWISKGSMNVKAKVKVQASTTRAVPNAKPNVTFK